MKIRNRIDRQIRVEPKIKYVTVKYDVLAWGILELSPGSVEKIYNFVKTLPLKRSSTYAFGGTVIGVEVRKGHEQKLANFIRDVARSEFSEILDQDDVVLMKKYREDFCLTRKSKCPNFVFASYSAFMNSPF